MADHIDLTKDSDDERENNKRTIDLTADSQEEPPPRPAQRARTSQEYSTRAPAKPEQRLSIGAMRAAITQARLATATFGEWAAKYHPIASKMLRQDLKLPPAEAELLQCGECGERWPRGERGGSM